MNKHILLNVFLSFLVGVFFILWQLASNDIGKRQQSDQLNTPIENVNLKELNASLETLKKVQKNIEEVKDIMRNLPGSINQKIPVVFSQSDNKNHAREQDGGMAKKAIYDQTGFPVAEYSEDANSITFRDGIFIPEDNKLLLTDRKKLAQGLKSKSGGKEQTVKVQNNTGDIVYVFWIDYEGNPRWRGKISAGAEWGQIASSGAPFVFTSDKGKPFGSLTVDGQGDVFELKK
jgi:hypothetical protein